MTTFTLPTQRQSLALPPGAFGAGEGPGAESPLRRLGNVLRRRARLVLGCALTSLLAAGAAALLLKPAYTARAQIIVTPQVASAAGVPLARADEAAVAIETEISVIGSRDQMNRILDHLLTTPDFPAAQFGAEGMPHRIAQHLATILEAALAAEPAEGWIAPLVPADVEAALHGLAAPPDPRKTRERIVDEIERNLKVNAEPRSRVISIRYTAQRADLAALVANTAVDAYLDDQRERKREGIRQEIDRLDRQLPETRQQVETAAEVIRTYRIDHAIPDSPTAEQQEREVVVLKKKVNETRDAMAALDAEDADLVALRAGPADRAVDARTQPRLSALLAEEQRLVADPNRAGASAALAAVRRQIVAEVDAARARLADDRAMLNQRAQAFAQQLDTGEAVLREVQPAAEHLRQLQRLADAKRQLYEEELLLQQRLRHGQDTIVPDANVLSAAFPPQKPSSASPILFLPPALVLGLLIGGFAALWRDGHDTSLRDERTLPDLLGVPSAGFLPHPRSGRGDGAKGSLARAALRAIFVGTFPIHAAKHDRKVVLVTSSVGDEGGLDLAERLARYAAGLLPRVLLIDLRHRGTTARSMPPGEPDERVGPVHGMVMARCEARPSPDVLSAAAPIEDPIAFLVAGEIPQRLRRLREVYDCIVVHAGPILETVEAQMLAGSVDHILLAVEWGRTPRRQVENALAIFGAYGGGPARPGNLAAILTHVRPRQHLSYRFGDAIEALIRGHRRRRRA